MSSMCLIPPPPVCRVPDLEWPHLVHVLHTDVALAELLKVDRLYRPLVVEIATRILFYQYFLSCQISRYLPSTIQFVPELGPQS